MMQGRTDGDGEREGRLTAAGLAKGWRGKVEAERDAAVMSAHARATGAEALLAKEKSVMEKELSHVRRGMGSQLQRAIESTQQEVEDAQDGGRRLVVTAGPRR